MDVLVVAKGDFGDAIALTLVDDDDNALDCSSFDGAVLWIWDVGKDPNTAANLTKSKTLSWVNQAGGTATVTFADGDITSGSTYYARVVLTTGSTVERKLEVFWLVVPCMTLYTGIDEVKHELGIDNHTHDAVLHSAIQQACGFIDHMAGRTFIQESETRYFDGEARVLFVDDLISVTTLKTDEDGDGTFENTLTANTDYVLYPLNSTPKTTIKLGASPNYGGFAPGIPRGVEIAGVWGYSSVPHPIRRAAIIQASRWWRRKDTAYADVISSPELGLVTQYKGLDPDIAMIVKEYKERGW